MAAKEIANIRAAHARAEQAAHHEALHPWALGASLAELDEAIALMREQLPIRRE